MVLIVGHRGNPARYPDNSLAGFVSARDVADMAELDVRRTADDVAVLSHDPQVQGRPVIEMTSQEVTALETSPGHPIITFAALLDVSDGFALNIEIKNHPDEAGHDPTHRFAVAVARLARPYDLITCFDWPTMDSVRRELPAVRTGLLVDSGRPLDEAIGAARSGGHSALAVHWTTLAGDPRTRIDRAGGLDIFVWTVNDPTVAVTLAQAGVAGVITDDPATIGAAIQERS
jgi:glycerophosphoryl diester phosphodiesterase